MALTHRSTLSATATSIWYECACGHMDDLGKYPTVQHVMFAYETHMTSAPTEAGVEPELTNTDPAIDTGTKSE